MPELRPEKISETLRAQDAARLNAYFRGTQYDTRPDWWTGTKGNTGEPVPLRERAPCIVYPLPKACVQQATRFCFGEGRFPTVKVGEIKAEEAVAPTATLTEDEATQITAYLAEVIERTHLKTVMRSLMRRGLSQRSACAVVALRDGLFAVDEPEARHCEPTFRAGPGTDVTRLRWCYKFDKLVADEKGDPKQVPHYFRREYDDAGFYAWQDASIENGRVLQWDEDPTKTAPNTLGCVPIVWVRNLPECTGDVDGVSLYEGLEDEFDALNLALSQRHRGIHYFGTPQAYESGVESDEQIGATGRTSTFKDAKTGAATTFSGAPSSYGTASRKARKRGADTIWQYRDTAARPGIIETTGVAFEVASAHVMDVRSRILEAIDVIMLDPTIVAGKGDMSAKALALMFAPMLALVDDLRECWWTQGLRPILSLILRITAHTNGVGIYIPGAAQVAKILQRFFLETTQGRMWMAPAMTPAWGAYFAPTTDEIALGVTAAVSAKQGGVISASSATRFVAKDFNVDDIDAEVASATKEADDQAAKAADLAQKMKPPPPAGAKGPPK